MIYLFILQVIRLTFTADDGKWKASVPVDITITKAYERLPVFNQQYNIKNIVANRSYGDDTLFQVENFKKNFVR